MSEVVLFSTIESGDKLIAVATLNRPAALNSLDLQMAELLNKQLKAWEVDDQVVVVILDSAGDKAFCAGGDITSVYQGMLENKTGEPLDNQYAVDFFKTEYELDYYLHNYKKPVIVWGRGIVMGGGIGLLSGASHRVVSDDVRLAMPEVTIGLFPDVGGSWLLPRLNGHSGRFLAATGAIVGSDDALFTGLADYAMPSESWELFIKELSTQAWPSYPCKRRTRIERDDLVHDVLSQFARIAPTAAGPIQKNFDLINEICAIRDYKRVYREIEKLAEHEDQWLSRAATTMLRGSPFAVALGLTLQDYTKNMSLKEVFELEYIVALHCSSDGMFQEGVRALLIDKDRNPQWRYQAIEDVDINTVYEYFEAPWAADADSPLRLDYSKEF
ncbi:MAG: enoyl-CoA hydratase/isomerase family protein [Alcaligenaceae bacterium]|nr:enoyl-CoA hydratase/isomerase family protein [Alcaligenaceae bacterium]